MVGEGRHYGDGATRGDDHGKAAPGIEEALVMRVLLMESAPGTGHAYESALKDAGHEVLRCHEEAAPAFPCSGIDDQAACPLHGGTVDVALLARDPIAESPTAHESGVSCALRARVPVVMPREAEGFTDPYGDYVEVVSGDIVAAVEEAAGRASAGHARAIRDHLLATSAADGLTVDDIQVVAWRKGPTLHADITLPAGSSQRLVTAAQAWAAGAVRRYDPMLQTMDFAVHVAG